MKHLKFLVVLCILFGCTVAHGQEGETTKLSPKEKDAIKTGIKELVNQFNDKLTEIWRRPNDVDKLDLKKFDRQKKLYVKEALAMFANNGDAWYSYDTVSRLRNGRYEKYIDSTLLRGPARIETTSKKRPRPYSQPVKTYLTKAANSGYDSVKVTSGDAWYCSDLKKVADGVYEATLSYTQTFAAYNGEGRMVYGDKVTKTIKAYAFRTVILDEVVWKLALGDIKAVEW